MTGKSIELICGMIHHEPEMRPSLEKVKLQLQTNKSTSKLSQIKLIKSTKKLSKQKLFVGLDLRKIDLWPLVLTKFGGSVRNTASDGMTRVDFHPTEPAAIIFCNGQLFFVKGNNPQESFAFWKWRKICNVADVHDLKWNVSVNPKKFTFKEINLVIVYEMLNK